MSSRERTAHWVHSHSPSEAYSPSVPPSVLDDDVFGSPPSDVESSHSVPPRMVLRYGDGRPDVPIVPAQPARSRSRRHEDSSSSSPISPPPKNRQRSGSHGSSPLSRSHHTNSRSSELSPPSPEEIRILPSHVNPGHQPSSSHPTRTRSRSLPRPADLHSHAEGFVPPPVAPPVPQMPLHAPGPASQSSAWHPYQHGGRHQKQPPAIVYAPSHHRTRYTPPPIYHYPPQMGPNGMIYSHSAPVNQNQYRHNIATAPYPQNIMHPSQVREDAFAGRRRDNFTDRDRAMSLSARGIPPPIHVDPSSSSSVSSDESGGTYYILPHQGQKVHIIVSIRYLSRIVIS